MLLVGSVKLDQIFRGTPNSPVSLLNKASICSTGLTPKVSENLSFTTFTINKDNSLTLTPVPKPPVTISQAYCDEPKFHKIEFTPRSTPVLDHISNGGSHRSQSIIEEKQNEPNGPINKHETEKPKIPLQIKEEDKTNCVKNNYEVFVPKVHKTYEEYIPNVNTYTEPNRVESRCSLKSPSSFKPTKPPAKNNTVVQERSVPVKTLIDTFEQNNRPVMRYLQLEESIPLSNEIKHLHDEPAPGLIDDDNSVSYDLELTVRKDSGFYTADTTVETRSFVYDEPRTMTVNDDNHDDDKSECVEGSEFADKSGITDRSVYGDSQSRCTDDVCLPFEMKFQTIRQLATPDSLESSMLFAQKQSTSYATEERHYEYNNNYYNSSHKVPGKTR